MEGKTIDLDRQVDLDPDVVSLTRLIDWIRRYPKALSRDRYAKQTAGWQSSEEASGFFDKLVGPGREPIDPNVPKADLAKLRTPTARIVRFATNELAHCNEAKGTFADGLTLGDLHGAISLIVDLSVIGSDISKTVAIDSWLHIFEQPWIADGDRLMEIHRRMEALWAKRVDGDR